MKLDRNSAAADVVVVVVAAAVVVVVVGAGTVDYRNGCWSDVAVGTVSRSLSSRTCRRWAPAPGGRRDRVEGHPCDQGGNGPWDDRKSREYKVKTADFDF